VHNQATSDNRKATVPAHSLIVTDPQWKDLKWLRHTVFTYTSHYTCVSDVTTTQQHKWWGK